MNQIGTATPDLHIEISQLCRFTWNCTLMWSSCSRYRQQCKQFTFAVKVLFIPNATFSIASCFTFHIFTLHILNLKICLPRLIIHVTTQVSNSHHANQPRSPKAQSFPHSRTILRKLVWPPRPARGALFPSFRSNILRPDPRPPLHLLPRTGLIILLRRRRNAL